jgi:hypothetical protein
MSRVYAVLWECPVIRRPIPHPVPFAAIQRLLIQNVKLPHRGHLNALCPRLSVLQLLEGAAARMVRHVRKMAALSLMEVGHLHPSPLYISLR